jgi:hypothetical protein
LLPRLLLVQVLPLLLVLLLLRRVLRVLRLVLVVLRGTGRLALKRQRRRSARR